MKKLVKIWFPIIHRYSTDMIVNIPDDEDPENWLAENRINLIIMHHDFERAFFDDDRINDYIDIGAIGAKFVTGKPDSFGDNELN